jgi:hypothetical protein
MQSISEYVGELERANDVQAVRENCGGEIDEMKWISEAEAITGIEEVDCFCITIMHVKFMLLVLAIIKGAEVAYLHSATSLQQRQQFLARSNSANTRVIQIPDGIVLSSSPTPAFMGELDIICVVPYNI